MKLRKFFGLTSRSVLDQVRTELGANAVIVANRPTPEGIEITALAGEAMDTLLGESEAPKRRREAPTAEVRAEPPAATAPAEPKRWQPPRIDESRAVTTCDEDAINRDVAASQQAASAPPAAHQTRAIALDAERSMSARLMEEFAAMRSLLEGQLAQLAWSDMVRRQPMRAQLTRELVDSGYSAALSREITQRLPNNFGGEQARPWLSGVIVKNLRCAASPDDIVTRGGVYALIGPTGVGKTTTTAKLAARCAVRYGAKELALLTTDSYRVGAQDQLRIYAKILGVTVHTIGGADDMRQALDSLRGKRLVLIDTVGMGQRDARVAEQAILLAQPEVRRILLLNAAAQAETLEEVVAAYRGPLRQASDGLAGCIVTKLDEAARPGQALDVIIRHRLLVHYVSNGQRVPEDLHPANATYLVHRSLKPAPKDSPFALLDDELALMWGSAAGVAHA